MNLNSIGRTRARSLYFIPSSAKLKNSACDLSSAPVLRPPATPAPAETCVGCLLHTTLPPRRPAAATSSPPRAAPRGVCARGAHPCTPRPSPRCSRTQAGSDPYRIVCEPTAAGISSASSTVRARDSAPCGATADRSSPAGCGPPAAARRMSHAAWRESRFLSSASTCPLLCVPPSSRSSCFSRSPAARRGCRPSSSSCRLTPTATPRYSSMSVSTPRW